MQTPFRVAYSNLLDLSAAIVTASTAAASFPATQVQSYFRALRWRSTGGTSSEWIKIDFGSAKDWNTVILWDHNLRASSTGGTQGTVTVEGSADGSSWTGIATGRPTLAGRIVIDCGDVQYRYCRISLADASNPDGYLEVGRVFVGAYLEAEENYSYGWEVVPCSRSQHTETPNGVSHALVRPQYQRIAVQFERVSPVMRAAFRAMIAETDSWMPMWIMLNVDVEIDTETYYVKISPSLSRFVGVDHEQFTFPLEFIEVT